MCGDESEDNNPESGHGVEIIRCVQHSTQKSETDSTSDPVRDCFVFHVI